MAIRRGHPALARLYSRAATVIRGCPAVVHGGPNNGRGPLLSSHVRHPLCSVGTCRSPWSTVPPAADVNRQVIPPPWTIATLPSQRIWPDLELDHLTGRAFATLRVPIEVGTVIWLYPDFPKSTNTLYLYILRAKLSVRPAQVDGIYVNIISHGSTPARTRACSDTTPRPDALYRALSRLDAVSDQAHVNVTHCQI